MSHASLTPLTHLPTAAGDDAVADFISALLNAGEYEPSAHGISEEFIYTHAKVHAFATEYQRRTGHAPSPDQVLKRFSDFPYSHEADVQWASFELIRHTQSRTLRSGMNKALRALVDEDPNAARSILLEAVEQMPNDQMYGSDAFDHSIYTTDPVTKCPVAGDALMEATGGIAPGNIWVVAGRTGRGKSFELLRHGLVAAQAGWDVAMFEYEMSKAECQDRLHRLAVGWEPDRAAMVGKVREFSESLAGTFTIYGNDGRSDVSINGIRSVAKPGTLILIDYIGKMPAPYGTKDAKERIDALSEQLKMIAQREGKEVPIITAAQLNRDGDEGNKDLLEAPIPSLTSVAQTDGIAMDGDLVYFIRGGNKGSRVREGRVMKYRHGPEGQRWFLDFHPEYGQITEIDGEQAFTLLQAEKASRRI